jgi:hypothetical protein
MIAIEKIRAALNSGVLTPELTIVPARGATHDDIESEEAILGRPLCADHVAILRTWNGLALDILRLFGCGPNAGEVGRISDYQFPAASRFGIVIGSDASGFAYIQTHDSRVLSFDSDGSEVKLLATGLDEFFERLVFGPDAERFGGSEWFGELRDAGMI